jgi:hypothetical protein
VTLDWDQFAQRVNAVHRAVEAHSIDKAKMAVPLVMNAWYHAGAADVALELITNLEDPDRRGLLANLFAAPPDLLDWTAFSLGARSASSTLDLCAAAAWRLVLQPEFVIFMVCWLAVGSGRHERGLAGGAATTTSATGDLDQPRVRRPGRRTGAGPRCRSTG